ncbi:hypothetical protein P43SY_006110 [Pythium insidiosum]|uniref:EF-hand domain-containing protein n=1 Tax=Pythium insidiosum TaxID=114742 RepID=A0AAD5LWJ7_PYTIN|nr:hypothetical protein P43SY_006110 [Pythium insidiosum]
MESVAGAEPVEKRLDTEKPVPFPYSPAEELKIEAMVELQQRAVRVVSETLSCPCVYIGLQQPSLDRILFTAATERSVMVGKHVHRGRKGLSFHVVDRRKPLVLTRETQADVERACGSHASMVSFSAFKWPVLMTPIGSLGVLSLDNLERYERLASVAQPEIGVLDFVRRVAMALHRVLVDVRERTAAFRAMRREQALVRVLAACETNAAPLFVQHVVLRAVEHALNGVDGYIGLVEPLCAALTFTSATSRSQMMGQRVNTVDSVSFQVFLAQRSLVIPQLDRFDLDDPHAPNDAGWNTSTLQFFSTRPRAIEDGRRGSQPETRASSSGPFVCVPIPYLGVLSVDALSGAAGGCYASRLPEPGVLETLEAMAKLLGQRMQQHLANATRRVLPTVFRGNRTTLEQFFGVLLREISKNVVSAVELHVMRARYLACDELKAFVTLQSPCAAHVADAASTLRALAPAINRTARTLDMERVVELPSHPEVLVWRCAATRNVDDDDESALYETFVVVRRVTGASWAQDSGFLSTLTALTDEILCKINDRVRGIVARRNALAAIDADAQRLETAPSSLEALAALPPFLQRSMHRIATAASDPAGDVYLAERQLDRDELRYIAASEHSRMLDVTVPLASSETTTLTVVQTLLRWQHSARDDESQRRQRDASGAAGRSLFRPVVTYLPSDPNVPLPVRVLSSSERRPQGVFVVVPMLPSGTDSGGAQRRLVCVDSLAVNAFDVPPDRGRRRLEQDVLAFLERAASRLETAILSVQFRADFDALCALKTQRHASMRRLLAMLHDVLRRHLGVALQSQQILRLSKDFMGSFDVLSWQHSVTPRPRALARLEPHFCYRNGCEQRWLTPADVHFERHTRLPMTNLPRTLDRSRATLAPAIGRERDAGAFAVDCLATMLDASLPSSSVALCAFSHTASASVVSSMAVIPSWFSPFHRQFFAAFAAVASDVYAAVFRACVLDTFAVEWAFFLREALGGKDTLVLTVDLPTQRVSMRFAASSKASVTPKLAAQALQLAANATGVALFVTKKPLALLLRTNALRKCVEIDPTSTAKWAAILRAASHLKERRVAVHRLSTAVAQDGGEKPRDEHAALAPACRALAALHELFASLVAAVRYFKHLQEMARQRRDAMDATATVLQCRYRVVRAKRELRKRRRERLAAITIQCAFRQHLARRKCLFLRWTRAATTVQRAFRRRQARRRGRKPRLLGDELRAIAERFGGVQSSLAGQEDEAPAGEWRVDMVAFDSFKAYAQSRAGREQLRREQAVLTTRMSELQRQREQRLDAHERLLADAHDVFELLDVEGSGELSRERTRELLTRLHVPLHAAEADDVIAMMDSDGSGAISFVEFSRWFTHELLALRRRRRDCGVLSKADRQWMVEEASRSALRKRWLAVQRGVRPGAGPRPPDDADA